MLLSDYVFVPGEKAFSTLHPSLTPRILKDLRYVPEHFKLFFPVPTCIKIYIVDIS